MTVQCPSCGCCEDHDSAVQCKCRDGCFVCTDNLETVRDLMPQLKVTAWVVSVILKEWTKAYLLRAHLSLLCSSGEGVKWLSLKPCCSWMLRLQMSSKALWAGIDTRLPSVWWEGVHHWMVLGAVGMLLPVVRKLTVKTEPDLERDPIFIKLHLKRISKAYGWSWPTRSLECVDKLEAEELDCFMWSYQVVKIMSTQKVW